MSLSDKRKGCGSGRNYPEGDVRDFIKTCEEIITRRCMGTSANCYEIKKEIRDEAGDYLK